MKFNPKSIYVVLLLAIGTCTTGKVSAQIVEGGGGGTVIGPGGEDCRIRYHYDPAGNRIKREHKCVSSPPGGESTQPGGTILNVYPNPTTGVFHAEFSELVSEAYFVISASNGSVVQTYELMQPAQRVTFDITAQVPGTYFLTVWALNKEETYSVIKSQ